ncbi:MAG: hypothetical protein CVU17_02420 [Betaproteobacteria bacterium HGW-Betaproteobacteria-11]|nr:MAG: hypothetical protein CVU17_02420 [Betaproteobacteria bacterium HGW-Betaproteobacteria-11]
MSHVWKFFRAGGFDQVRLDTAADLLALKELDQKLWVALACPTTGVEFDARTLALIDTDNDGRIRAPELLAAVDWAAARLADPEVLGQRHAGVPLAAIGDAALASTAQALLHDGEDVLTVQRASEAEAAAMIHLTASWAARRDAVAILGEATETACAAFLAMQAKVDDYFARCRLAAFDPRAGGLLNANDEALKTLGAMLLTSAASQSLPLAKVPTETQGTGAGGTVPLAVEAAHSGINPAWAAPLTTLRDAVVVPLLGARETLDEADWRTIQERLAPFLAWQAANPEVLDPTAELPPDVAAARDLERLARYVRDLLPLANNLVAFRNFYTRQGKAMFQLGTLYLDGRAAELVVAVNDAGKHAALASLSRLFLVYCDCVRNDEKLAIAAAFTAGDADQLMAGRNGVFYDSQGRDWDATIVRIVDHPISLRQAFWSPYKKMMRLVGEQLQKVAASKAGAAEAGLAEKAAGVGKVAAAPPKPVAQQAFDVGKFAGIFAAIGLAVGAIGTALASMLSGLFGLKAWQIPLALVGLMLAISLPAVVLAWFKLRHRSLGPLLDANGWAINTRARINIPFGTSLTQLARLPAGSERALVDPYAEREVSWVFYALVMVTAVTLVAWLRFG